MYKLVYLLVGSTSKELIYLLKHRVNVDEVRHNTSHSSPSSSSWVRERERAKQTDINILWSWVAFDRGNRRYKRFPMCVCEREREEKEPENRFTYAHSFKSNPHRNLCNTNQSQKENIQYLLKTDLQKKMETFFAIFYPIDFQYNWLK